MTIYNIYSFYSEMSVLSAPLFFAYIVSLYWLSNQGK